MAETTSYYDTPIKATCHCGNISVTAPGKPKSPDFILECQCSLCRRYAAAWAYYGKDEVKVEMQEGAGTRKYMWGVKTKTFEVCDNCGCMMYWWPLPDQEEPKMGLNTRNVDPDELRYVDRKVEYSWLLTPIKDPSVAHRDDKAQY